MGRWSAVSAHLDRQPAHGGDRDDHQPGGAGTDPPPAPHRGPARAQHVAGDEPGPVADKVGMAAQRIDQPVVEPSGHDLTAPVSLSSLTNRRRSVANARAVWLLTVPREISRISAISASPSPS